MAKIYPLRTRLLTLPGKSLLGIPPAPADAPSPTTSKGSNDQRGSGNEIAAKMRSLGTKWPFTQHQDQG
ncbi:hypothetical protein HYE68_001429 [Fusarium pseudograminearum]|uniref:Uncharacterized protein n=1 Tax=Fusarium pseudograminearum (strain CS3096) TaxID=1028729 RepID=K3VZD2_FUSPC|nr:hypothetical protein FPSE_07619 [Fusarium pseudograminearum CS3096]EKJ72195.1 hypothetical protein FPSE_07619 [Fusarium pseudograminearum CS3096]QPC70677.1 hypothetical protein HYE68_001429 [Fusarium pseudograminearum]